MTRHANRLHRPRGVAPAVRTSRVARLSPHLIPDLQAQREARYEAIANQLVRED